MILKTRDISFEEIFLLSKNYKVKEAAENLDEALTPFGFKRTSKGASQIIGDKEIGLFLIDYSNPYIDRKVQLNWSNRSKTIDIYILKGFAFIKWSDILDKEFGERIDELSETELSVEQAMIRNELFIDSFIAYQNEPFVRDLLQGKIWKEYPFDWGNYK